MIKKRRGVTLLEMLIVIGLLLILSGVTIFSTLEVTASADANNIITDMINIKQATLIWYNKNHSRIVKVKDDYNIQTGETKQSFSEFIRDHYSEITKYITNLSVLRSKKSGTNNTGDYSLIAVNKTKQWYVCCNLGPTNATTDMEAPNIRIKNKLAGNVKTYGLRGKTDLGNDTFQDPYTNQKFVCMHVLTLAK